jgi:hypothetical protein
MYKLCWCLWIGGTAIVAANWLDIVGPSVGWIGWGVALAGTLLSFGAQQAPRQQAPKASAEFAVEEPADAFYRPNDINHWDPLRRTAVRVPVENMP